MCKRRKFSSFYGLRFANIYICVEVKFQIKIRVKVQNNKKKIQRRRHYKYNKKKVKDYQYTKIGTDRVNFNTVISESANNKYITPLKKMSLGPSKCKMQEGGIIYLWSSASQRYHN